MAVCWVSLGLRVEVVTFRDGCQFYPDEMLGRVSHVHLGTRHKWASIAALWRYLRVRQPRVILSAAHIANLVSIGTCRLPGVRTRCFLSVGNAYGTSDKNAPGQRARKFAQIREHYPKAQGIIAVSQGVKEDLQDRVGLDNVGIRVIYNGTLTPQLLRDAESPVNHPWLKHKTVPVVMSAGRLARQKDFPSLIRAFRGVRDQQAARLVILGEGGQRGELEALIGSLGLTEDVALPGHVDNPLSWVARSDAFVLSSLWEGIPNALIEALALGVPLVATDCPGGSAEVLGNGRHGVLVEPGSIEGLKHAMLRALGGKTPGYDPVEAGAPFRAEHAARQYLDAFGISAERGHAS
ncbi:glycosyltransferase [Ectothiorhodospira sp. BSL-9]|uniref:glycosyltransferase n=1 Tax=Ectothiorhodospira sp. BSL-9 TaxID=1442136 RepID=UPI001F0A52AA|nr:glycosyltransferase [Ectothiorhodospira sp. BSL-9]